MKKIFLIAALLSVTLSVLYAKEDKEEVKYVLVSDDNATNYYYEGVVPVESVTKEEMFKRAKNWALSTFRTGDNNIQFDEKELTIYNSSVVLLNNPTEAMSFKVAIYFKDGKYKFRFDNIIVINQTTVGAYPVPYGFKKGPSRKQIKKCNEILFSMSADLEKAIKGNSKDDW